MADNKNIPSNAGQQDDHGHSYYLRIAVERVYDRATNKSTLTITPQFKGGANNTSHGVEGSPSTVSVNGTTVINITESSVYGFTTPSDGSWASLKRGNDVYSATYELAHAADGTASARFQVYFRTYGDNTANEFTIDYTWNITETISGTVQIYDGSNWVECKPYVYDGTNWVECEPYVYTNNEWVKY